jgi:endo-1,4-beta-xylanase
MLFMQTRSRLLRNLIILQAVLMVACKKNDGFGPTEGIAVDTTTALKNAADFPIGVAISRTQMLNDARYSALVKRDFDAVTFDYHMKHGAIVKNDGYYDFSQADPMVAALGDVALFGHTLGWHSNQNALYMRTAAGLVPIPGPELLPANQGFESGITGWDAWNTGNPPGSATVTANNNAADAHSGGGSMKVVNPTAYPGNQWRVQIAGPEVNTIAGRQYLITYWVKAATAGGSIRLSTATSGGGGSQYQGDQTIGTAWQQVTWNITANSPKTRFLFDMGQAANTYYIDDASFKELVPGGVGPQTAMRVDTALNRYITTVVNHFKSKVRAWDVVNELFADNGAIRDNQNTATTANDVFVWSNYMGRDFGLKAFNYARAADPTAELFINDYNLEASPAKLDSLIAYVGWLRAQGAKVDGIGSQMHITTNTPFAAIDDMMRKLAATGLKVRVSELDIAAGNGGAAGTPPTFAQLANQSVLYKYVVASYLRHVPPAQRAGITVWGLTDNTSWLYNNGAQYPLLYDINYNRKPAYSGFLSALRGEQ